MLLSTIVVLPFTPSPCNNKTTFAKYGSLLPSGIITFDGSDSGPSPFIFVACTVNVYDVPFVNPETIIGDEEPTAAILSGVLLTVYPVIVEPPLLSGGVKLIDAD